MSKHILKRIPIRTAPELQNIPRLLKVYSGIYLCRHLDLLTEYPSGDRVTSEMSEGVESRQVVP